MILKALELWQLHLPLQLAFFFFSLFKLVATALWPLSQWTKLSISNIYSFDCTFSKDDNLRCHLWLTAEIHGPGCSWHQQLPLNSCCYSVVNTHTVFGDVSGAQQSWLYNLLHPYVLDIRINLFPMKTDRYWNRLLRGCSLSVVVLIRPEKTQTNMIWLQSCPCLEQVSGLKISWEILLTWIILWSHKVGTFACRKYCFLI